jgi:nitric oxide reductase activation protein
MRFVTQDGKLAFLMRPTGNRIYVERIQNKPLGARLVQCMLFQTLEDFSTWADSEPLRFEDPGLHQRICRCGEQILQRHA